jgi:hypothetical protein
MQEEYSTLEAEFELGKLVITGSGPAHRESYNRGDLVSTLNLLAENGWKAKSLSVSGLVFTVSLERLDKTPPEIPKYSLLTFHTTYQESEHPPWSYDKQPFNEGVQFWVTQGWREINTVFILPFPRGLWMVSLLEKERAQAKHSLRSE